MLMVLCVGDKREGEKKKGKDASWGRLVVRAEGPKYTEWIQIQMALQILLQPLSRGRDSPPNKIKDADFLTVPDPDDALRLAALAGWKLGRR